ncbi:hypothetical protein NFI96_030154, partial [Prochilodus magdalenae]
SVGPSYFHFRALTFPQVITPTSQTGNVRTLVFPVVYLNESVVIDADSAKKLGAVVVEANVVINIPFIVISLGILLGVVFMVLLWRLRAPESFISGHRTLPHRTVPTGRRPPKDAAPQDAAHRTPPPKGHCPTGRCPLDAAPLDAAPQDAAPQDTAPQDAVGLDSSEHRRRASALTGVLTGRRELILRCTAGSLKAFCELKNRIELSDVPLELILFIAVGKDEGGDGVIKLSREFGEGVSGFLVTTKKSLAGRRRCFSWRWTVRDDSSSAAAQCSVGHPLVLHQWTQDTAPQDTAPQDTAPQDTAPQDTAPQDTAPQDTAPQDTAPQDTAPQDTAPQDSSTAVTDPLTPAPHQCHCSAENDPDPATRSGQPRQRII